MCYFVWGDYISSNLKKTECNGEIHDQAVLQGDISIGEGSIIEPGALIIGPVQIVVIVALVTELFCEIT